MGGRCIQCVERDMKGKVYIIGSGCGSYDLITLRGMEYLHKADTVVYDALIDQKLLLYAAEDAELICVGKRAGSHSASQADINALIVKKALEGHIVARLKGGDPFVFGRGGEEIAALKEAGITFTIVPGVSSAIAVPELAGIPVTYRKVSRSFHVITGHTADEKVDISKYACLEGTLVFLMGLGNINTVAEELIRNGKKTTIPAAVISEGASERQFIVRGTLSDIAEKVRAENIKAPAVIVIGETAAIDFAPTIKLPLERVSVTVTGTAGFCKRLSDRLSELGAAVETVPHLRLEEYKSIPLLDKALAHIEKYGCIAFTGRQGAEIFLRRLKESAIDVRRLSDLKIAAIGSSTAEYLADHGLIADIVPDVFTSAALAGAIAQTSDNSRKILIARAEKGSSELTDTLKKAGFGYDDIRLYDTAINADVIPPYVDTDYIVFGSSAGITGFVNNGAELSEKTKIVCIGSVTASVQNKYKNIITAFPHTVEGVINAIITEESK